MSQPRICLFFSDTGVGHRSAAEALEQAMRDLLQHAEPDGSMPEIFVENMVEKTHPLNRKFVELYNFMLRHCQAGMKYYYWWIETFKPNDSEVGYKLAKPYLVKLIDDSDPTVVVSVHPMSNHYVSRAIADTGRSSKTKMVTVVTDPNGEIWRGWACPTVDMTIVPNELGKDALLGWGIDPQKIKVEGMPVHPDFLKPATVARDEFLVHLGLEPTKPTLCINAGWAGGGNMLAIYDALVKAVRDIQVIFLCGHNRRLYERVKRIAKTSPVATAVLPFHDKISDLMSAVDMMVTKPGGLTSFEAIARRLPMVLDLIAEPMPQEAGTARLLCDQGLAQALRDPRETVDMVAGLKVRDIKGLPPLPKSYNLSHTDAVYDIAVDILELVGVKVKPGYKQLFSFEAK